MKILLAGATGLIGQALSVCLEGKGHTIYRLVRNQSHKPNTIFWDPSNVNTSENNAMDVDVVINLAGANIGKRWNEKYKSEILDSRVQSTKWLVDYMLKCKHRPRVILNASAVGYYGDRGEEICTEGTSNGTGFLAEVCQEWENQLVKAKEAGIRTVSMRFGIVLSKNGGALAKMLVPFKLGLGGVLGSGAQYMSWISVEDVVKAIVWMMENENIQGAVNVTSPNPVPNREFTKVLAGVLHRPAIFPVPAFVLKLAFGTEMAEEMFLASTRAVPEKLLQSGFVFESPGLKEALESLRISK